MQLSQFCTQAAEAPIAPTKATIVTESFMTDVMRRETMSIGIEEKRDPDLLDGVSAELISGCLP